MRLGGVILCGGHSTRMGQSKALLPFGGSTMLQCTVERLITVTAELVVVAAHGQELPHIPDRCRIVRDEHPNRGPLEGLRIGLAALVSKCDAAFVTGCDTPMLVPEIVTFLASKLGDAEAVVVVEAGRPHPLTAVYRTSITFLAADILARGESRLHSLFAAAKTNYLDAELLRNLDPELFTLRNLNSPEEYRKAVERNNS
jgi:molybdenum cofactor guanylyltransferase